MDVYDAIRTRRAVRLFSDPPVADDVLRAILDGGRRAQSSKNTQPWQFVVIRNRETLTALSKLGDYAGHLAGADFAVVLVGLAQTHWNSFDLGQAAAHLQLTAWNFGVGSCIAALYDQDAARSLLGIPPDANCYAAISFGYPSPDHQPARLGGRKVIDEVTRWEKW